MTDKRVASGAQEKGVGAPSRVLGTRFAGEGWRPVSVPIKPPVIEALTLPRDQRGNLEPMPVIVAFGDSNTWGSDPATGARISRGQRWPTVMGRELGPEFEVIAEGLRGRTTVHDDPIEPFRSGAEALPPCLMSHAPIDLVILALGCNDLKKRFSLSAFDIAEGAARLIFLARAYGEGPDGRPPRILLIAPPPLARLTGYAEMFEGGTEKSRLLAQRFGEIARQEGVAFLDAGAVIRCSDHDGIHYEADQHAMLGRAAAGAVRGALARAD
jgi:lysophospholipase L1-like esterase